MSVAFSVKKKNAIRTWTRGGSRLQRMQDRPRATALLAFSLLCDDSSCCPSLVLLLETPEGTIISCWCCHRLPAATTVYSVCTLCTPSSLALLFERTTGRLISPPLSLLGLSPSQRLSMLATSASTLHIMVANICCCWPGQQPAACALPWPPANNGQTLMGI